MLIVLLAAFGLAGCTRAEAEFYSATQQLVNADYYEMDSTMALRMDYTGGNAYIQSEMDMLRDVLGAVSVGLTAKVIQEDPTDMRGYFVTTINPLAFKTELWMDMDLNNNKYDIIFKIPELLKTPGLMPEPLPSNINYLYMDYIKMMEADGTMGSTLEIAKSMTALQQNLPALAAQSGLADSLSGIATVTSTEQDGRKTLTLSISDMQLKALIANGYAGFRNSDLFMQILGSLPLLYVDTATAQDMETYGITPSMLGQSLAGEIDAAAGLIADVFTDIPLLGDQGITYSVTLNDRGVIQSDRIVMDFRYDLDALSLIDPAIPSGIGTLDMTMTMNNRYSRINAPGIVSLPPLSGENSIDLSPLMGAY
jgi:hypothetical protein